MVRISLLDPWEVPENEKYNFCERAQALAEFWYPTISEYTAELDGANQRWFAIGKGELFYRAGPLDPIQYIPGQFCSWLEPTVDCASFLEQY